jgi:pyruvate/2-oxoglutarate dehydrogenase complex dihydrolipoamide acyltransferase (E2) component
MSHRFTRVFASRRSAAVAGTLALSVVLAACGGSGTPSNSSASAEKSREHQFLALAKCLREHGLKIETPGGPGGGKFRVQGGPGSVAPQTFEAARNACKKYAPAENVNLTPQQRVERQEAVRKFAKCMREHGIKVETKTSGDAIAIGIHAGHGESGPNPESPAFEAAQKACQSYLPFKGGPPRGGPGGGPSTNRSGPGPGSGQSGGFAIGG